MEAGLASESRITVDHKAKIVIQALIDGLVCGLFETKILWNKVTEAKFNLLKWASVHH